MSEAIPLHPKSRLDTLLSFLEQDPTNVNLIADAAMAAADEGRIAQATALIERFEASTPLSPGLVNLKGVIALHEARFADAAALFEPLLAEHSDPVLRFNLAWAKEMTGQHEAAAALIDDAVVDAAPRAAALKVQALHQLGRLEEALSVGEALVRRRPQDPVLMGALASVAIDAFKPDLARRYGEQAGENADGLSALGALALEDGEANQASALFERALKAYPDSARALLGKGLALMNRGQAAQAAPVLERAAEIFGRHLGSWVGAGWAWLASGDLPRARATFDNALSLDDTFAETHGALAVLDFMEGNLESAKQRAALASRLDRQCFSAALARSLIASARGDEVLAERIRKVAFNTPISEGGPTLGRAMSRLNVARTPRA